MRECETPYFNQELEKWDNPEALDKFLEFFYIIFETTT